MAYADMQHQVLLEIPGQAPYVVYETDNYYEAGRVFGRKVDDIRTNGVFRGYEGVPDTVQLHAGRSVDGGQEFNTEDGTVWLLRVASKVKALRGA